MLVEIIGRGVELEMVEFAMTGTISHFLPLNPEGHSHLNDPSSIDSDVHFPSFWQAFGFSSQNFSSENHQIVLL